MSKRLLVPLTALVVAALTAIAAYRGISGSSRPESRSDVVVGRIDFAQGSVETRRAQASERVAVQSGQDLRQEQVIYTERASQATVSLRGGAKLLIEPGSRFVAEADRNREGVINGTLIEGTASVLNTGKPGSFHLFKDGRELPLGEDASKRIPVVPIVSQPIPERPERPGPSSKQTTIVTASTPNPALESSPTPSPPPAVTLPDHAGINPSGPLSNDEIRASLRGQTSFFQRCYLAYLGRSGEAGKKPRQSGVVTVGFSVAPNGKVRSAKLVRSDFKDTTLNKCVLETVERTSFRAFDGDEIPVLEFPIDLG